MNYTITNNSQYNQNNRNKRFKHQMLISIMDKQTL